VRPPRSVAVRRPAEAAAVKPRVRRQPEQRRRQHGAPHRGDDRGQDQGVRHDQRQEAQLLVSVCLGTLTLGLDVTEAFDIEQKRTASV
jgi:hypothetical protein